MSIWEAPNDSSKKSEQASEEPRIEKENPEHIPTAEEVLALFEKLVGEEKFSERRKLEDEQGLYLWEIEIAQEDGGTTEYSYARKGDYKARGLAGGSASETAIHVTFFDSEGIPYNGYPVRKLRDGKWIEIS